MGKDNHNSKTRAGLRPADDDTEKYRVETDEAAAWISNKIALMINKINDAESADAAKTGRKPHLVEIPEMALATKVFTKKFAPFEIAFSMNAVKGNGGGQSSSILDIFNPDPDDNSIRLRPEIYSVIAPYLYNTDDIKAFFSSQLKHTLGTTTNDAHELKTGKRFRVTEERDGGRRVKFIHAFVDPLRIFHDMCHNPGNPKEKFQISIPNIKRVEGVNYEYLVVKKFKKNGKNNEKDDLYKYLAKNIRK